MPLLELKELKRLGFGFGIRQRGLLAKADQAPATDFPSGGDMRALAEKVRSCLADSDSVAAFAAGDQLSFLDLAHWVLSLQRRARIPVFAQPIPLSPSPGKGGRLSVGVLVPYVDVEATRLALAWAIGLVNAFADAAAKGETAAALDAVSAQVDEIVGKLGPHVPTGVNTYRICEAAYHERIPFTLFFRDMLLLGEGIRLKRMLSTITDAVSPIGVAIARNKTQSASALRQAGFPTVQHTAAKSEDHAVTLARKTGFPTVVKPADADGGAGVSAGLMTEAAVRSAYRKARKVSNNVLVEAFVAGNDYRVTIYNGRIVKTTVRRPGGVDGDGVSDVRALVEMKKDDPQSQRRRLERGRFLLELDDEARELLVDMGMTEETVPPAGQFVPLRRRSNVSTGGTTKDIHGTLHPDNEAMLLRVVDLLGLDFAGVDYISPDISKSWTGLQSAVLEINAQPQLDNDLNPTLYNDVLRDYMGSSGRVPWVLLLSGDSTSVQARSLGECIRHAMEQRVQPAVVASSTGVWLGSSRIAGGQGSLASACESVVMGRFAAAAVVVADPSRVVAQGLPTEDLDFVVLTNDPRPSAEAFELCRKLVAPHIRKGLLLEVGDPAFGILKSELPADKLFLVCPGSADDAVRTHLAGGGRAVWLESTQESAEIRVVLGAGQTRLPLGTLRAAGADRRAIRDVMIARVIEVYLPARKKPGETQQGT